MSEFDTLFPHDITGEMTALVTDLDDTPNHVLDRNQAWRVRVRWSLTNHEFPAANLLVLAGHWQVTALLEAVGVPATPPTATQGIVATLTIPYVTNPFNPNATFGNWNATLTVPAGTVNVGGVYKVTVMLAFHDSANNPTDMVGFVECPMVAFHD